MGLTPSTVLPPWSTPGEEDQQAVFRTSLFWFVWRTLPSVSYMRIFFYRFGMRGSPLPTCARRAAIAKIRSNRWEDNCSTVGCGNIVNVEGSF